MKTISMESDRKKIKEQALAQLRKTRSLIDEKKPGLLDDIGRKVEQSQAQDRALEPQMVADVPIDQKKNLGTIMKMLEDGQKRSDHFQNELKKMLLKKLN